MSDKLINRRFYELDALRGISALGVVLFHFTFGYDNGLNILSTNKFYFKYGYLGIYLFFLISGFVIFMTLEKSKNSLSFIVSRFSRLYPTYWAAIILTIAVTFFLTDAKGIYTTKQILLNFTMFQYWFKVKDIDGAYWTLAVELTFYFLMWVVFVTKTMEYIQYICLTWLLLCFSFAAYHLPFKNIINVIFIIRFAPLFVGGIIFYLIKVGKANLFSKILLLLSLITQMYIVYASTEISKAIVYTTLICFYIIFYLFVNQKLIFLTNKILLFFGSISYALYLIHENIGSVIITILKKVIDSQLFYLPITILIVVFLAYLITVFVEKPTMLFIKNIYKKKIALS